MIRGSVPAGALDDIAIEPSDSVQIERQTQLSGDVLYINVNGVTVVRICRLIGVDYVGLARTGK